MNRIWPALVAAWMASAGVAGCKRDEDYVSVRARRLPDGAIIGLEDGGGPDGGVGGDGVGGSASGGGGNGSSGNGPGSGDPADGGGMDGGLYILDGSVRLPDGSELLMDGAIELPDGEIIDTTTAQARYGEDVDIANCSMSEADTWETAIEFGDEGGFTLAPGGRGGFVLTYRSVTAGNCTQNLNLGHMPALGAFPMPTPVLPDCKTIRDVAVFDQRDRGYLAWVDNFDLTAELHVLPLGPELALPEDVTRKSVTMSQPEFEMKPVMGEVGGRPLLAWIVNDAESDERGVMATFLDADPEPFAILGKSTSHAPNGLAFTSLGIDGTAAVAWVGAQQMPGVWLQPLDAEGRPVGTAEQLTERVGASSSVSLAPRRDGGAVAYSIVIDDLPQVRFRRLDSLGMIVGDERSVVGPPMRAQDASLGAIGGGYVMAYRALPGGSVTEPEIRLQFLTREGTVVRDAAGRTLSMAVAPATISTGRTAVAVSLEGQIMIGWIDADPEGGGNLLKLVRRRLDCGS